MSTLWQDVKYAARMLARNPGFTLIAILTLALGIGVNTAQFSIAEAFLIHPYPFHYLNRLAVVLELRPHETKDTDAVSPANYDDWRKQAHSFEQFSAYRYDKVNLSTTGAPQVLMGSMSRRISSTSLESSQCSGALFFRRKASLAMNRSFFSATACGASSLARTRTSSARPFTSIKKRSQ